MALPPETVCVLARLGCPLDYNPLSCTLRQKEALIDIGAHFREIWTRDVRFFLGFLSWEWDFSFNDDDYRILTSSLGSSVKERKLITISIW